MLTPDEQRVRNEQFEKDNQAALDKSENAARMKEINYNVQLKEDSDLTDAIKVVHPKPRKEGEAAAGTEALDANAKIFKDIYKATDKPKTAREKIQMVLDL